ncbi:MAG TPA: glutamate racemase [Candidatus Saccharibacteria bacterium]|nr:glutamate racemase [Candidatus Saccharibacteria bacterium]
MKKFRVGVFDSGVGGKSVANAVESAFGNIEVICVEDSTNLPYGTKTVETLEKLVVPILQDLAEKVDVIIIACNTISTVLGEKLRQQLDVPIILVVPMVKTASSLSKKKVIAVCATPTTLGSQRYQQLKEQYAHDIEVIEPDCSDWSSLIEANEMSKHEIGKMVDQVREKNADVIVLGCTHYHWIEDLIVAVAGPKITVLQPEPAIILQLRTVLEQLA